MGLEGFSRFPSLHSLVGSDGFVPKSIVPTVGPLNRFGTSLVTAQSWYKVRSYELVNATFKSYSNPPNFFIFASNVLR